MVTVARQTQEAASSPQGCISSDTLKYTITERTLILIMEEVQYFFILHVGGCLLLQP